MRAELDRSLTTLIALTGLVLLVAWIGHGLTRHARAGVPLQDIEVLVDAERTLSRDQALASGGWEAVEGVPNFGLRDEAFWFRAPVRVAGAEGETRLLELAYPILDSVRLWVLHGGETVGAFATGDGLPFEQRPVLHHHFVFPLELPPGDSTVVLRVETEGVVQAPLTLWDPIAFIEHHQMRSRLDGGFFGVMAVMVFYNLILYLSIRERPFLWYVGHVVTTTLFLATMSGLSYMHLWPQSVWWQAHAVPVLVSLSVVFISRFAVSFLHLERSSFFGRWFRVLAILALLGSVAALVVPSAPALAVASLFSISALASALVASIWGWLQGNRAARFLVVAWGAFIGGSLALAFSKLGVLPSTPLTDNGMLFGSILDVVFLSLAITDRIRQERFLREEAQQHAVTVEQQARAGLERSVAERTEELRETMDQLSRANRRLEGLSSLDGLTGVYNRRHFDQALRSAWEDAAERGAELSLLSVDVDQFKRINDSSGHLVGDDVLRRVVGAIADAAPPVHLLARLGGDEFALLLPDASLAEATRCGESVLRSVAGLRMDREGDPTTVTVSIGIGAMADGDPDEQALLARADRALYRAKESGRNRVEPAAVD